MSYKVSIGKIKTLKNEGVLFAYGLGSCIGLFLYDQIAKVGGLAHIMLSGSAPEIPGLSRSKYAENAIEMILQEMEDAGARKERVVAMIAGGAHMFRDSGSDTGQAIGEKNISGVRESLKRRQIPIAAEDVGEDYGRTIEAHIATGQLIVKSYRRPMKTLK
jgi:chemotaxis protein CheD